MSYKEEPTYEEVDGDGYPTIGKKRSSLEQPKWRTPATPFQISFLALFGLKLFPDKSHHGQEYRSRIIAIEKARFPMALIANGNTPAMPTEWVDAMIQWCRQARANRKPIWVDQLLNLIENEDKRNTWINEYSKKHPVVKPVAQIYTSNVEITNASMDSQSSDTDL